MVKRESGFVAYSERVENVQLGEGSLCAVKRGLISSSEVRVDYYVQLAESGQWMCIWIYLYFPRLLQGGRDESTPRKKTFRASKCTTVLVKYRTRWPCTPVFVSVLGGLGLLAENAGQSIFLQAFTVGRSEFLEALEEDIQGFKMHCCISKIPDALAFYAHFCHQTMDNHGKLLN